MGCLISHNINMVGQKFGQLTVVTCKCDWGNTVTTDNTPRGGLMLIFPHQVGIRRPAKSKGVAYHDPEALACQFTPARMGTVAFNPSGVQIESPHLLMWSAGLPEFCPVGSVFDFEGDWYVVQTPTEVFRANPVAASSSCHCEKMQFAPEALGVIAADGYQSVQRAVAPIPGQGIGHGTPGAGG